VGTILKKHLGKSPYTTIYFLLPALLFYVVILIIPIIQSGYYSAYDYSGIADSAKSYIGFKNYAVMFKDPNFYRDLANTGKLIVVSLIVHIPLAFGLALVVSSKIRGAQLFKTLFFIPTIIPLAAVSLMWVFIYNHNWGVINTIIRTVGFENFNVDWLGNMKIAMYSVSVVNAWVSAGESMIIFAAGMTAIPEELYEAAGMDGATGWKRLWYITIPMLKETFRIYFILVITGALKAFNLIFVMTVGGPNGATEVPTMMVYFNGFKYYNYGYASAVAVFILATGFFISYIINKLIKPDKI
jgi:raffinose/stachyose/melibiose transport system permease protein